MGERKKSNVVAIDTKKKRESRPASNPDAREQQLVSLAVDLAEKQLRDGTASSAVMTHYLKLATKRETLEREILERQSKLIEAKATNITKENETEQMTKDALNAMKTYTGNN